MSQVAYISTETHGNMSNSVVLPSDILLNITGASLGRCAIYPKLLGEANVSQHVTIIRPIVRETTRYLHVCILSPYTQFMVWTRQVGMAREGLSKKVLEQFEIPLPPLSEQHRIVAKVDELMALCDRLEQQQADSQEAHQTLVETLLGMLTRIPARAEPVEARPSTGSGRTEFEDAWNRIADHFDTLFTTEHSIDQLKQTILQLAVMGKLVHQDQNDEPANVLLKQADAAKRRLVIEGKIGAIRPLPPVNQQEMSFDLPYGWEWTRFDALSLHSEAGWSPSCDSTPRHANNWGVLKVSAVTWGKYNPCENKALPANIEPRPELEVAPGDFLISRANTAELVARAVVVPSDAPPRLMMSDKIIRFVFAPEVNRDFLILVNECAISREYYARVAGGTSSSMKNVSREQIRNLVVALPPLAEQHRIVAKVDELMALCDTLKARLKAAQTTQMNLADAIVELAAA